MIAKTIASILTLVFLTVVPCMAGSTDPMETIRTPIDALMVILNDPQYKEPGTKAAQRDEIWKIVKPMFDFVEISKRTVARNWRDFSDAEKTAFTDVFAQFLANTYIDKIQGEYHNEKIVYLNQDFYSDAYAEVKTQVLRETAEIPVNYRMFKDGADLWKVYDIIVEGVSLVKNYRTQFASILKKDKPAALIQMLNEKLAKQNQRLAENG
ncbi:toluene tolerance protein [Desulfosarcina ovata subsp. sediminis]|uniref:Toluene tolerance protein n=1 Tax=Desulfosarcina ovata subsp. sediminis TaxID=885957 RepID=A0A5K7ZTH6_9BACT|nr:ABC transporter substrate-binding protein [Desulfosarcina ovata]BBO83494.1 toluene tolerance protein [Desulfosarcina ovata subsp. sediminis]